MNPTQAIQAAQAFARCFNDDEAVRRAFERRRKLRRLLRRASPLPDECLDHADWLAAEREARPVHGGFFHRGPARRFSGCGGNLTAETLRTAETAVLFSADSAVLCASAVDLVAIHIDSTHLLKVAQNIINQWFVNLQKSAVRPVRAIGFTIATP
jgi:hypothetical protein